jgi:hypothetical protein
MIRYTKEVVVPRLGVALDQLATEPVTRWPRRVSLSLVEEISATPVLEGDSALGSAQTAALLARP